MATDDGDLEAAVIVHLVLDDDSFGSRAERDRVVALEDQLTTAVDEAGGVFDGDEFGDGEAVLYVYGPNTDALVAAMRPALAGYGPRPGSYAETRSGSSPNAPVSTVPL